MNLIDSKRAVSAALCLAGTAFIGGCYVEEEPARARTAAPAATTDATEEPGGSSPPARSRSGSGGNSTLGKAKGSAKSTVADLELRDRELQKQLEDQ